MTSNISGPRLYDGDKYTSVDAAAMAGSPPPQVEGGNGLIFVSIVSYRDGERCAETIHSIFENAKDPDRIIIGLAEQNAPEDNFCLEEYCKKYGLDILSRRKIRDGVVKVMANPDKKAKCPRYNQVRMVSFYHVNAKGPILARSMVRKVLGNEEFCMQIDAHSTMVKDWDEIALTEWKNTRNEYGIITHIPYPIETLPERSGEGPEHTKVSRQCRIRFRDNKFPDYVTPADAWVEDLDRPLLARGWSAAFSFAKCHLEESAPYDPFLYFSMPIEQFSRYARFWTRGYDTYTPTRNIVFHDYQPQANGHGNNEWFKRQRDRFRKAAIARVKTILQIPEGDPSEQAQANLGIYGIGKRRSLEQLQAFVNVDLQNAFGNVGPTMRCTGAPWVPFDEKISPVENLFDNPDNLDPQPEFPLRTQLTFYQQIEEALPDLDFGNEIEKPHVKSFTPLATDGIDGSSSLLFLALLLLLWMIGLIMWCAVFLLPSSVTRFRARKKMVAGGSKDV